MGSKLTDLSGQRFLHILLYPPEQEWLQLLVEGGQAAGISLTIGMVVILKVLPLGKPGNGWVQMNDRHYIT
jgi:hypothetical protein